MSKLTEDETVIILVNYLKLNGWTIDSFCLGQKRGNDIVASKTNNTIVIEVKGARAGDNSPQKKREIFDKSQIKTHFGKAIVKVLDEKLVSSKNIYAIAHPDDKEIRNAIGHLIPFLKTLEIIHFWVSKDGTIIEE